MNAALIAAAHVAARQKAMLHELQAKGATTRDHAQRYDPPQKGDSKIFDTMIKKGLVETDDGERYWVSQKGAQQASAAQSTSGGAWVLFLVATAMIVASIVALITILD